MPTPVRNAFGALLIAAVAVAAGLAIAQDQETLRLRSARAARDPESPAYLAALTGSPISTGNAFTILQNGDAIYRAMLDAIAAARERISFETFMVEDGTVARRFAAALGAAARRGVTVNIPIDDIGAGALPDDYPDRLRAQGCHVGSYNDTAWYALEEVNYRTHRKILVVDGTIGFTGGAGLADHWLGDAEDPDHWRDTHVRLEGPVARQLEAAFYENFVEEGEPLTPVLADAPPPAATSQDTPGHAPADTAHDATTRAGRPTRAAAGQVAPTPDTANAPTLVVRSAAASGNSDMKRLYLLLLASARHTIDIATPYFVPDESSQWALADAVRRGTRVRILTEGNITDAPPVKYASRRTYEPLLRLGIELYEYRPTMLHAKVMVVDGIWSMFGSANFDNRSLELNDELNVVVHDRGLAAQFDSAFEADLRRADRITLESFLRRPWLEQARERFWGAFGEIF